MQQIGILRIAVQTRLGRSLSLTKQANNNKLRVVYPELCTQLVGLTWRTH